MLAVNRCKNALEMIDLSQDKKYEIKCEDDEVLRPIGFIEKDFVYGIGKKSQIVRKKDGTYLYPLEKVLIQNQDKILKEYEQKGVYITEAKIDGTTVMLTNSVKKGSRYQKKDTSYVRYKKKTENKVVFVYGYTGTRLNQLYLSFPDNVYIQSRPNYLSTNVMEQDENISVKFAENNFKYQDAYVYTGGKLSGVYSNMKDAVKDAKDGGGVVVNYHQMYLWEKGIAKTYARCSNIPMVKAKSKDETDIACILMMAQAENIDTSYNKIKKMRGSAYDKLFEVFDRNAVNYSDCSMEDLVYAISKNRSVMAKRKDGTYVLLMSYNQSDLRYYDPLTGKSVKVNRASLEKELKAAGSIFYSYTN